MKKIFFLSILSLLFLSPVCFATESAPVIGVLTNETGKLKLFDIDGNTLSSQVMLNSDFFYYGSYTQADIHSTDGLEWINYDYRDFTVYIKDQLNTENIDSFTVFSGTKHKTAAIAVGELNTEYDGLEIAVCRTETTSPKVKIYNYSEANGVTEILSFKPFGENITSVRGCGDLEIGDVDGGDENEIVITKSTSNLLKIFNLNGEEENRFESTFDNSGMTLLDINGDETKEILGEKSSNLRVVSNLGETMLDVYGYDYYGAGKNNIPRYAAGDINNDGKDEIIIQRGRTANTRVLDENGDVISNFVGFPNAYLKKSRRLFVAPFAY